jgi:hypothetical protein
MRYPEIDAAHGCRRQFVCGYPTTIDSIITSGTMESLHRQALLCRFASPIVMEKRVHDANITTRFEPVRTDQAEFRVSTNRQ